MCVGTVSPILCPLGHYCPARSEFPTPCPRGTFLEETGRYSEAHCDPCTDGYACESVGLPNPDEVCSEGFYCFQGSNASHPQGYDFGDRCPPGYYCPEGTGDFATFPCPNGTYSNSSSMTDVSNCTQCEPGKACIGTALTEPNANCSAGHYCRVGAYTDKPNDDGATGAPCPTGYYCPEGTGTVYITPPPSPPCSQHHRYNTSSHPHPRITGTTPPTPHPFLSLFVF